MRPQAILRKCTIVLFLEEKTLLAVLLAPVRLELPAKLGNGKLLDLPESQRHGERGNGLHCRIVLARDEPDHLPGLFGDLRIELGHYF